MLNDEPKKRILSIISFSPIPSSNANSIQTVAMANVLKKHFDVVLYSPFKNNIENRIQSNNVITIENFYGVHQINFVEFKWRKNVIDLIKLIFNIRNADYVYSREIRFGVLTALIGKKTIIEFHDFNHLNLILKFQVRHLVKKSKLLIVSISKALSYEISIKLNIDLNSITVLPDGAYDPTGPNAIRENRDFITNETKFDVGYFGNLYPGRGIEIICELALQLKNLNFFVIGGQKEVFDSIIKDKFQLNNLHHFSAIPPASVHEFAKKFKILIAPYQNVVEVFGGGNTARFMSPLKIFEYMSTGVPIIASDLPVLHEILRNKVNSILVPSNEIVSWVNAVELLIKNEKFALEIATNAKNDLIQKYSWEVRAEKIYNLLS